MRIQNNIMAMNTHRQLGINNLNQTKSTEKLSSGYRINRAADDASGLSISEKMRAQIRGLNQASANAQDGISLVQAAEGALQESHSILQRMRELAVKAANDVNETEDRGAIKKELEQLTSEVDRIANTTEFNKKTLLDGSLTNGTYAKISSGTNLNGVNANNAAAGDYNVSVTAAEVKYTATFSVDSAADATHTSAGYSVGGKSYSVTLTEGDTTGDIATKLAADMRKTMGDSYDITTSGADITVTAKKADGNMAAGNVKMTKVADGTDNANTAETAGSFATIAGATTTDGKSFTDTASGITFNLSDPTTTGSAGTIRVQQGSALTLQVGANTGVSQTIKIGVDALNASGLGIDKLDVTDHVNSQKSIDKIEAAIQKVSDQRSGLGAVQNRLEHTVANLDTVSENLQAAESRIRDVDMAKEMMAFTKNNILSQAATAMLAQANQAPQSVLSLLR